MKIFLKILSGLLGLFLVLLMLSFFYFKKEIAKPNSLGQSVTIEIDKGKSTEIIAKELKERGVISNDLFFRIYTIVYQKRLNSGFYEINPGLSIVDVANLINEKKVKLLRVTFPEGWRMEQMAAKLSDLGIVKYDEFVQVAKEKEGELFPDTYLFNPKMTSTDIVDKMTKDFKARTDYLNPTQTDLIIASFVEREAINDTERPLIAGIYRNRIKKGMKLEADPTVQYGKDNNSLKSLSAEERMSFQFWKPIKLADYLTVKSEYNTYLIPELPPAPICNPGAASIEAAINYAHHNYLYFLQANGKIYPSETAAQHDQYRRTILGAKI